MLQDLANKHDIGKWYLIVEEIKYSKFNLVGSIYIFIFFNHSTKYIDCYTSRSERN